MKLDFGIYHGKELSDPSIPDDYVCWLSERGSYTLPGNRFETTWHVPIVVSINARREMEKRGWKHNGDRWKKDEK
uniref:Uncharacterized protein n=1 Tax=viral metagenome TaxID=1070528 RepID=A0A6H1ZUX4_9ZZZZ